jgi:hypothetical protein
MLTLSILDAKIIPNGNRKRAETNGMRGGVLNPACNNASKTIYNT